MNKELLLVALVAGALSVVGDAAEPPVPSGVVPPPMSAPVERPATNSVAPQRLTDPPVSAPAGYLKVLTPLNWRNQTPDWYLRMAWQQWVFAKSTGQSGLQGVSLIDRQSGAVLGSVDLASLVAYVPSP